MRIAICDDERRELEALSAVLASAAGQLSLELRADAYSSGEALVQAVENGARPDLAILDVYMEGMSGMDAARRLRKVLPGLPLAFLTVSRDFAVDAFAIEALHYIVKPVSEEAAENLLRRLLARIKREPRCLVLSDKRKKRQFPLERLRYLLSADKGVELYFPNRREWFPCPFRQAAEQLEGEPDFLRISRGCIINLNEVLYLGRSGFHLKGGEALAVSRRERSAVQDRYNEYLFQKLDHTGGAVCD